VGDRKQERGEKLRCSEKKERNREFMGTSDKHHLKAKGRTCLNNRKEKILPWGQRLLSKLSCKWQATARRGCRVEEEEEKDRMFIWPGHRL